MIHASTSEPSLETATNGSGAVSSRRAVNAAVNCVAGSSPRYSSEKVVGVEAV